MVQARSEAAANGITDYVSVTDMATGTVLAQTSNAGTQVASESIVKLMIAAYYMVIAGGYQKQSSTVRDQLSYMIRYSDDATASAYFTSAAVPTIAARYGMRSTINATDRVGHWGAVRITAHDMTTFLFRAMRDPAVGPWLKPVMAQVAPNGSDGFNQHFGMNALTGTHGSKQGWGDDQFWSAANNVINSVGYTDRYYVAVLQNSYSYPDPARATSTYAARQHRRIPHGRRRAAPAPIHSGDFVRQSGTPRRLPHRRRSADSGHELGRGWRRRAVRVLTAAQWSRLRKVPADGTYITAANTHQVFRIAGGAPIYVRSWAHLGGVKPTVLVDGAAVARAGAAGAWSHLRAVPADGTFITSSGNQAVYRILAGTPTYVSSWSHFGGKHPSTLIDATAVARAGQAGAYAHLRKFLPEGYFIRSTSGAVYRIVGSAPVVVTTWSVYGGAKPSPAVDSVTIARAGQAGVYSNMTAVPRNGTFIRDAKAGTVYRMAGGAPLVITSWPALGGMKPTILVDPAAIAHGGGTGAWSTCTSIRPLARSSGAPRAAASTGSSADKALYIASWAAYGGPHPTVTINQSTVDRAGSGGAYNHLRR